MLTKLESIVPPGAEGMSLSAYLDRAYPLLGKVRINKLIASRQVKLNGVRADKDARLKTQDSLVCYLEGRYDLDLKAVYQDEHMLAFIKPRGLPADTDETGNFEDKPGAIKLGAGETYEVSYSIKCIK